MGVIGMELLDLLPELGRMWVEFSRDLDEVSVSPDMVEQGAMLDCAEAPREMDWFDVPMHQKMVASMLRTRFLFYPVYSTGEFAIGRMVNSMESLVKVLSPGEYAVEERFCMMFTYADPLMCFTVRLSNDSVVMSCTSLKDLLNIGSGSKDISIFHRDFPSEKRSLFKYQKAVNCAFCSAKKVTCECSPKMKDTQTGVTKRQQVEPTSLVRTSPTRVSNFHDMRMLLSASTPIHLSVVHTIKQLQGMGLQLQGDPETKVTQQMRLVVSANTSAMSSLKLKHIQAFILRSTSPLADCGLRSLTFSPVSNQQKIEYDSIIPTEPIESSVSKHILSPFHPSPNLFARRHLPYRIMRLLDKDNSFYYEDQTRPGCQFLQPLRLFLRNAVALFYLTLMALLGFGVLVFCLFVCWRDGENFVQSDSEKPRCETCGAFFGRKYELRRHIKAVHSGQKAHRCGICGKGFALKHYLTAHMTGVHENRRDAICPVCGASFATVPKLRRHYRCVHLKDKPFSCSSCSNLFYQVGDLRRHCARTNHPFSEPNNKSCATPNQSTLESVSALKNRR